MEENYDVILFFGSPFGGKTSYFRHVLRATHQRVSAKELFQENPEMGLRQVILKVASLLRNGKKVVIDDENWSKATRSSYIKTLRSKLPHCKVLCVKFHPEEIIPYWLLEWYLAERVLQHDLAQVPIDLKKAECRINQWFRKPVDEATGVKLEEVGQEEFMKLKVVKPKLLVEVDYKFEVPSLFLQWQAITTVSSSNSLECHTGLVEVVKCWLNSNPWGRIIIIFDGISTKMDSSNSDSEDITSMEESKPILKYLCQDIAAPIYTFHLQTSSDRLFCRPPKPGILAFLQRLHLINLFHKHTLYLHCNEAHAKMAEEAGVRHSSTKGILCNPKMVIKSSCATKVAVKLELKNIEFKERVEGQRSSPVIPLFADAKDATVDEDWGYFEESTPWKYVHGVCFKSRDTLERYQHLYAETASRISDPGTKMAAVIPISQTEKSDPTQATASRSISSEKVHSATQSSARVIPSWLVPKTDGHKKSGDKLFHTAHSLDQSSLEEDEAPIVHKKKTCTQPSTVYCMNVLELIETAQSVLLQSGESITSIVDMTKSSPESKFKEATIATNDTKHDGRISPAMSSNIKRTDMSTPKTDTDTSGMSSTKKEKSQSPKLLEQFQERQTSASTSVQIRDQIVPETITTIPETVEFQSVSTSKANILSTKCVTSQDKTHNKTNVTKSEPDLSFLDDIF